ncbi:uncharacterized protein LOC119298536 [Triticum dicoccoides]|uniref:uncharacterized protein LOC119298536 n=1 Tax=Triticum dicoccoides TaxID=85692 RepID=UPI00188F79F9|nr:uncharacterized protein LOC119298536 [Triticum dicoccoides]
MDDLLVQYKHLVFDPTVSPHYQVFSIPSLREQSTYRDMGVCSTVQLDRLVEKSEWPPSTYILDVFSSMSDRWEERPFAREGDVAGIVEARQDHPYGWSSAKRGAAYWQQALYVHCQPNAVMRISLSDDKYRVIKLPTDKETMAYLGRSKKRRVLCIVR